MSMQETIFRLLAVLGVAVLIVAFIHAMSAVTIKIVEWMWKRSITKPVKRKKRK